MYISWAEVATHASKGGGLTHAVAATLTLVAWVACLLAGKGENREA